MIRLLSLYVADGGGVAISTSTSNDDLLLLCTLKNMCKYIEVTDTIVVTCEYLSITQVAT